VRTGEDGRYFVVEGNRRLAAMKLLSGQHVGDGQEEPKVPSASADLKTRLLNIHVHLDWDPQELDAYLGYKHVTSTKEWSPEAKARFVLKRAGDDLSDDNLRIFSRQFGTTIGNLKRWITALLVLQQAESLSLFDPQNVYSKRYFGTFYTLMGGSEVQKYLGLNSEPLTKHPVDQNHRKELGEFIHWTIGTKKDAPVINSRTQKKMEDVLRSPNALNYFRINPDVDAALQYTEYTANEIADQFRRAAFNIEQCLPKLNDVKDRPDVAAAFELLKRAYQKARLNMTEVTRDED
jgi:hypothetical protein